MTTELQGMKVVFAATDGVEQVELTQPWQAVANAGGTPILASMKSGKIQGFNHHVMAEPADRPTERGGDVARRAGHRL